MAAAAAGFVVSTWLSAKLGGFDAGAAVAVGTVVATLILAPLNGWASRDGSRRTRSRPDSSSLTAIETPSEQLVLGNLPGQPTAWQDRVEVIDRLNVAASARQTASVCALTGPRGVGKTQVAAAYARHCVAQGWPVVVWVVADVSSSVLAGLDELAAQVGVRPPRCEPADGAAAALQWLGSQRGPALLVFDNAVDPDLIRRWTPTVGGV